MDLNELLFHHQRAILHASHIAPGPCPSAFDLVGHYADRLRVLRERLGVATYPEWMFRAPDAA